MRSRPSARLLVIDPHDRILLFRFTLSGTSIAIRDYWAKPGGSVEGDETYADAARRELFEETGFDTPISATHVAEREFVLTMHDGEQVLAQERYFVTRVPSQAISIDRWTDVEREIMTDHKWWPVEELRSTNDIVFPENIVEILASVGVS